LSDYKVQAHELNCEYAPGRGVCGLSLTVEQGECFALLGRNGSGKSTLLRLILGLEKPSHGTLIVLGYVPENGSWKMLRKVGVSLESNVLWEQLTGMENAYFVARSYRIHRAEVERRLKNLFQIAELHDRMEDKVHTYSFGMRKKLAIIQALAHDPELLILDEPTMGIDPQFRIKLAEIIRTRTKTGLTTIIAGNDPDWTQGVAFRVAFMKSGKIVASGSVEQLLHEISVLQEIELKLEVPVPIPQLENQKVRGFTQNGQYINTLVDDDPSLIPLIMEWIVQKGGVIQSLKVKRSTLRDAYLLKTGHKLEE
jgi:ABC-type multidrug transport system ATPase subunit